MHFLYCIFSMVLFIATSSASQFSCFIEEELKNVAIIRKTLLNMSSFSIDTTSLKGKMIVSIETSHSLDSSLENIPIEFKMSGKIPKGVIDFIKVNKDQYLKSISNSGNELDKTDFIFTGYGYGGQAALILSALWSDEYLNNINKKLQKNQIKCLTFSTASFGDTEFNDFMKDRLGQYNILDFSPYFSTPTKCGVPISFCIDEQIGDSIRNASLSNIGKIICAFGFLGYTYYTSNHLTQTGQALTGVVNTVISNMALDENDVSMNKTLITNLEKNRDSHMSTLNKTSYSIFYAPLYLVGITLYNIYKNYCFIPSEKVLLNAFKYTQQNYSYDNEASPNEIGIPPLFSTRRGVAGWVFSFFGY